MKHTNRYSEYLAEKFKVEESKVSFARTELSAEEQEANEFADTSLKANVDLSGQKKETMSFGEMRIAI